MKNTLVNIAIILIMYSCHNRQSDNGKYIDSNALKVFAENTSKLKELNIKQISPVIRLDSIFFDFFYIKLETNPNCLIGKIDKILFADSLIIIVDKEISNSVFIYNFKGEFQRKIADIGTTKEKFVQIQDVVLCQKEKQILILDLFSKKINYYNYYGIFLKTIPIYFNFNSFACIDSTINVCNVNVGGNYSLPLINDFNLINASFDGHLYSKGFFNEKKNDANWTTQCQLWEFGKDIYYNFPFSDTIYRVTKDTLYAELYLNLNERNIPLVEKANITSKNFEEIRGKYGFLNGDFISLKDYVYLMINMPEGIFNVFYSKITEHILSGYNTSSKNPLFSLFFKPIARYKDNTLVTQLSGSYLNKFKSWQDMKDWKKIDSNIREKFLKLFENTNEEDNPILLFYTMKDF